MTEPDTKKLKRAGLHRHNENVWLRQDADATAERLRQVDLVASDVDECMLPFIGQAKAGLYVLRRVALSVRNAREAQLAARMGARAGSILAQKYFHKLTGKSQNSRLILQFQEFVMGAPMKYFESSARRLVHQGLPGVDETFRVFNRRGVPAGLISLGLDVIVDNYGKHLHKAHGVDIAFTDCTRVIVDRGKFGGYDPRMTLTMPEHKARRITARAQEYGAACPLVIGHDRDDMEMFRAGRELGGMALGVNPMADAYPLLDIAVFAPDWHPVAAFLSAALDDAAVTADK